MDIPKYIPMVLMEKDMKSMPFVNWDRFIVDEKKGKVDLYGWIDRQKDSYKDFILLEYIHKEDIFWDTTYSTSSVKYDKEIFKALGCVGNMPNKCQRVESIFKIPNMIKLAEGDLSLNLPPSQAQSEI